MFTPGPESVALWSPTNHHQRKSPGTSENPCPRQPHSITKKHGFFEFRKKSNLSQNHHICFGGSWTPEKICYARKVELFKPLAPSWWSQWRNAESPGIWKRPNLSVYQTEFVLRVKWSYTLVPSPFLNTHGFTKKVSTTNFHNPPQKKNVGVCFTSNFPKQKKSPIFGHESTPRSCKCFADLKRCGGAMFLVLPATSHNQLGSQSQGIEAQSIPGILTSVLFLKEPHLHCKVVRKSL